MALVTHHAIVSNIDMGPAILPMGPEDSTVVFLPSAHIAQRVVMEFLPIRCGMPVTFAESLLKLPQEIRRVRPTILLAPRACGSVFTPPFARSCASAPPRRASCSMARWHWRWRRRATAARASRFRCEFAHP